MFPDFLRGVAAPEWTQRLGQIPGQTDRSQTKVITNTIQRLISFLSPEVVSQRAAVGVGEERSPALGQTRAGEVVKFRGL